MFRRCFSAAPVALAGLLSASEAEAAIVIAYDATITSSFYSRICVGVDAGYICDGYPEVYNYSPVNPTESSPVALLPTGSVHRGQIVVERPPYYQDERFLVVECWLGSLNCYTDFNDGPDVEFIRFGDNGVAFTFAANFSNTTKDGIYPAFSLGPLSGAYWNDYYLSGSDDNYSIYGYVDNFVYFSISNVTVFDTNAPGCGPSGGVPPKCGPLPAVPLPASLPLLGAALLGAGLLRWLRGPRGTAPHPI